MTFVGALTAGGLVAPWALEGAINGEWPLAYVEQVPASRPGVVVVMDDLPSHEVGGVREAIEAAKCRLDYRVRKALPQEVLGSVHQDPCQMRGSDAWMSTNRQMNVVRDERDLE